MAGEISKAALRTDGGGAFVNTVSGHKRPCYHGLMAVAVCRKQTRTADVSATALPLRQALTFPLLSSLAEAKKQAMRANWGTREAMAAVAYPGSAGYSPVDSAGWLGQLNKLTPWDKSDPILTWLLDVSAQEAAQLRDRLLALQPPPPPTCSSCVTQGVRVTVQSRYARPKSSPGHNYVFTYSVCIQNESNVVVQARSYTLRTLSTLSWLL